MDNTLHNGLFIAFEGGEGSGKSTQARMLAEALTLHGIPNRRTREPGGTAFGDKVRTLLLGRDSDPMSRKAEALLFAANRADHVEKVIVPALTKGEIVVCDRYVASSMAYQSYAGDLDEDAVRFLSEWASGSLYPDITFFLDVDPVVGLERSMKVEANRFEDKAVAYHDKVRRGFINQKTDSWVTVDAHRSLDEMHDKIFDEVLCMISLVRSIAPERLAATEVFG